MTKPLPTAARREEITRAAASLFAQRGFHNASMEDIAEAIGVRKPTLYHYVRSKSEIVAWIHDECVLAVLPPLQGYVASGMAPPDVLFRVVSDILRLLEDKPGYLGVYFDHHRELPKREQLRSRHQRDEYYALVQGVIEAGVESGDFETTDARLSTLAFFGMCNWAYQWFRPNRKLSATAIAEHFSSTFLNGMRTRDAPLALGTARQ